MFEIDPDILRTLLALAIGTGLTATIITWVMARRHGWKVALLVPLGIVLCAIGMVWRIGGGDGFSVIGMGGLLAAPGILGALIGLLLARWTGPRRD